MAEDPKTTAEEKDGRLVVQMQLPERALELALAEGTRATIIKGAVGYIIEHLTPERITQFATKFVDELTENVLRDSWKFRQELEKVVDPIVKEALQRPENIARLRRGIDEGIEQAIKDMPEKTREAVVQRAMDSLKQSWERR